MKSLFYALVMALIVGVAIILMHFFSGGSAPTPDSRPDARPVTLSPGPEAFSGESYADATTDELFAAAEELYSLWHVREAMALFERVVERDSLYHAAYLRLVECYADPQISREDAAREAIARAERTGLSADAHRSEAYRKMFIDDDPVAAQRHLQKMTSDDAPHRDRMLAQSYLRAGNLGDAARTLEQLVLADDTEGRVLELAVHVALADNDIATASERARELARMYADEPHAYVVMARVELARGDAEAAQSYCNSALGLDPRYLPAIHAQGHTLALRDERSAARVTFEKLLMFDDDVTKAFGHQGIAFVDFLDGQFEEGVHSQSEAIRLAMLSGAPRLGLRLAADLIAFQCELGQLDAAVATLRQWVSGFGDVPVRLGELRIQIASGQLDQARDVLTRMNSSSEWTRWLRAMAIDHGTTNALAYLAEGKPSEALKALANGVPTNSDVRMSREFVRGVALYQSGDAEAAGKAFSDAHRFLFGSNYPFAGDPVLYVQSFFYQGEAALAAGRHADAAGAYQRFLSYWEDAAWDLGAIARAREKLLQVTGTIESEPADSTSTD